jgi:uncharacterized protein (TIGR02147 family)
MSLTPQRYQQFLRDAFEERIERNAAYSLRAFARDLDLSVASLSRVLAGKQGLSEKTATRIAKNLDLNETELGVFQNLVRSQHARSKSVRMKARSTLHSHEVQVAELSLEYFRTIADWYHFAILELTELDGFKPDVNWIAKRLDVPAPKIKSAIQRMLELELLEVLPNGRYKKTADFRATPSGIPSRALKRRHHQILSKAQAALLQQPVNEREFASVTFGLHPEDLDWAKQEMLKFRRALTKRLSANPKKCRLYELSMSLFSLDHRPKGTSL